MIFAVRHAPLYCMDLRFSAKSLMWSFRRLSRRVMFYVGHATLHACPEQTLIARAKHLNPAPLIL